MKKIFVLAGLVVFFNSCNFMHGERVRGNGNVVTQERSLPSFSGVQASGSFDVKLNSGPQEMVKIEGEDNIIPYIETRIENGVLVIATKEDTWLRPKRDITIYVTAPDFSRIEVHGSGNITSVNTINGSDMLKIGISGSGDIKVDVHTPRLSANINGSGSIRLSGETTVFEGEIEGSGDIKAYELKTAESKVSIGGSGSAEVTVDNQLTVQVSGSGDVRYKGKAAVSSNINGSGSVTKKD